MQLRRALSIPALLFLSLSACSWAATAEGTFDRTLNVGTGAVDLDVRTGSGNISVHSGNTSTVTIHGKIQAHDSFWNSEGGISAAEKVKRLEANPPIEQNGNSIRIGHITDDALKNNVSISYEIITPQNTGLHSETGSGSVDISDLQGSVRSSSGSGSLRLTNIGGEVHANTGSGEIKSSNIKGHIYAQTGSGSIEATGVAGGFYGHTGSGDIKFEQSASGSVDVQTGSGSIRLRNVNGGLTAGTGSGDIVAQGAMASDWQLHSGSGSVRVELPQDAKFEVNARSSSGGIKINRPFTAQGAMRRNQIEGTVNGGGAKLDISTGSGSIDVI
ncbi:MAG TPA: DUF4097 family beta strand repeat-containing protein [Terriglobales bacterium]